MSEGTFEAFSPEFEWTTEQGTFIGRMFATYTDGRQTAVSVLVTDKDGRRRLRWWESKEVGKPDGNSLAEFEAWRMHATGHVSTEPHLREHVSFHREHELWEAGAYTARTVDHVEITHGLRVWTNDLDRGAVDLEYEPLWQERNGEWWFYVDVEGKGRVMQSETRVATRFEGKPA